MASLLQDLTFPKVYSLETLLFQRQFRQNNIYLTSHYPLYKSNYKDILSCEQQVVFKNDLLRQTYYFS